MSEYTRQCIDVYRTSKFFKFERSEYYHLGRKDKAVKLEFSVRNLYTVKILVGLGWNHKVPYPSTSSVTERDAAYKV